MFGSFLKANVNSLQDPVQLEEGAERQSKVDTSSIHPHKKMTLQRKAWPMNTNEFN